MNKLQSLALASILSTNVVSADEVNYSTGFSASDSPAFADGAFNTQNSWVAHPSYSLSDTAGTGLLNHVNANGPVHLDTSADITSELAAGKTITLTLKFNFVGTFANQNNGAWFLGLSDSALGMGETPAETIGSAVFQNNSNTNFWLSPLGFSNEAKFDTNIPWDSDYHTLTTTITRSETTNEFDITSELDGQSTSFTVTHADLWNGTDTAHAGFRFRGNQSGTIDSFSVSSSGEGNTGGGNTIAIDNTTYDSETGLTLTYTSPIGPVDVYRNTSGTLDSASFELLASSQTGGTYVDDTIDPAVTPLAFYILVPEGDLRFDP
ncbi:MAG: hypothetical protein ACSHYF_08810 [Verrucomicrobiaceae bacterium]